MYELMVQRDFIAQHYLTVPNSGKENEWHSHHFRMEVRLQGDELNEDGYLIDIVKVNNDIDHIIGHYKDKTLNDICSFQGLNPSIEHFSRIICMQFAELISSSKVTAITTKIWEDESAWASYRYELSSS